MKGQMSEIITFKVENYVRRIKLHLSKVEVIRNIYSQVYETNLKNFKRKGYTRQIKN
jgi:hypothetical protein